MTTKQTKHTPTPTADAAHIVRCVNAHDELVAALRAIEGALDGKRNRFGRLETYTIRDLESLRRLAVKYNVGESADTAEQAMKVARAILAEVAP